MSPEEGLWIFFRQAGLAVAGISGGLLVSGGVFTVLMSVGLVPRFAGKPIPDGMFFFMRKWWCSERFWETS